jgi:putative nucleotidyltransferase with HDIG domain
MAAPKGSSQSAAVVKAEPTDHELLHTIFRYIPQIANERNLDRLIVLLADLGRDLIAADRCTVWLIDQGSDTLWSKVAHGVDRIVIAKKAGIAGRVAATGEAIITNDPYNYECFDREVDIRTGYKTRSILALPIQDSEGKTIGVFQAVNKLTQSARFSESDMEHLLLAATYTGKQLESALLQEEIEATQKEIIFTLAETGEMRSKETGNHVKRVAEYSKILATHYGLDAIEIELLRTASPLHDIGKIAIPDGILLKPGKLTAHERKIMQSHTEIGSQMLAHSERRILKSAATIAREHHEKWDGEGYPRGLEGKGIHIFGRITALADVFDALASDRVYKNAWKDDRIIKLFAEERGRHFDPELTDVFLDNAQEFFEIRDAYRDEFPNS